MKLKGTRIRTLEYQKWQLLKSPVVTGQRSKLPVQAIVNGHRRGQGRWSVLDAKDYGQFLAL